MMSRQLMRRRPSAESARPRRILFGRRYFLFDKRHIQGPWRTSIMANHTSAFKRATDQSTICLAQFSLDELSLTGRRSINVGFCPLATGTPFLAQSDTILFQAANRSFFRMAELHKRPFLPGNEFLYDRNEAAPETLSLHYEKRIASETRAFV